MENARAALSLARIAGRVGFAGPTLTAFSPLLAGFFLSLGPHLRNLEQGFHALLKVLLRLSCLRYIHILLAFAPPEGHSLSRIANTPRYWATIKHFFIGPLRRAGIALISTSMSAPSSGMRVPLVLSASCISIDGTPLCPRAYTHVVAIITFAFSLSAVKI